MLSARHLLANTDRICRRLASTATPISMTPQTACATFIHAGKVPGSTKSSDQADPSRLRLVLVPPIEVDDLSKGIAAGGSRPYAAGAGRQEFQLDHVRQLHLGAATPEHKPADC